MLKSKTPSLAIIVGIPIIVGIAIIAGIPNTVSAQGGWSTDPEVNTPVCTADGWKYDVKIFSDEVGGTYVTWTDHRDGDSQVYVQHLNADGIPTWATNGLPACTYASEQLYYDAAPDGAGGLLVVWQDVIDTTIDVYAQRFDINGYRWLTIGRTVCGASGDQKGPKIVADGTGTGGSFVTWTDTRDEYDIYAQRMDGDGLHVWNSTGVAVCTYAGVQAGSYLVLDGSGGIIVAWRDFRASSTYRAMAQRLKNNGASYWTTDGVSMLMVSTGKDHRIRQIISDEAGGAYLSIDVDDDEDSRYDTFIQHVDASGNCLWGSEGKQPIVPAQYSGYMDLVPDGNGGVYAAGTCRIGDDTQVWAQHFNTSGTSLWTTCGVRAGWEHSSASASAAAVSDGEGGLTVAWSDTRLGPFSRYAQRLNASGTLLWNSSGAIVSQGTDMLGSALITTTDGGTVFAGDIYRDGNWEIVAQRIGPYGYLADPSPSVTAVADFPGDQGGQVTVTWNASYLDAPDYLKVNEYSVWMRDPESKALPMNEEACREVAAKNGWAPETVAALAKSGWGYVDAVPALQEDEYFTFGPTFADSTASGIPTIEYRIVAHTADYWITWESEPVAGYSVDNLVPGAPMALAGTAAINGDIELDWEASGSQDEDLAHYVIYRSHTPAFPLDPAHEIATSTSSDFVDPSGAGAWYYRVTAVDVHDNESPGSNELEISSLSSAPMMLDVFALHSNHPNPFNPRTIIGFDLATDSAVDLSVYALNGAKIATLVRANLPAGRHDVTWQGRDGRGRSVAAGVYVYRIEAGDFTETRRMVLVR